MKNSHQSPALLGEVLLVEDDAALNAVLSMQLKARGFKYRSAHTGTEALRMLEDRKPDLLILDVRLPELNGFEIIQILRQKEGFSSMRTMIHTAADLDDNERALLTLGHTVFVTKTKACDDICAMARELLSDNNQPT